MFLGVKVDRTTKKFGAANGQRIKALDEETIPFKTVEGVHRCTKFWSVVKPLISMRKVVQAGNVVVLGEKNPHIRKIRDNTVIKLDVNDGM